jgi:integrase
MPANKRIKTQYPGVYYVESKAVGSNKPEKIYYVMYRRNSKLVEEKAGRQYQDDMTPARAATLRGKKIEGAKLTNREQRQAVRAKKEAEQGRWTIDRLFEAYQGQRNKTGSYWGDKSRYDLYLKEPLGSKELKNLVPLDVDRIRIKLLKTKSPQTVKHVLGGLKRLHNFAVKKHLCPGLNFVIQMPKVDNVKTEDLNHEQLANLFEAIEKSKHHVGGAMMKTALYTGMRHGEMLKLKWSDIDFDRGFILIREPKGGVSAKIPMNDSARELFESLPRTSEFVFPGRGGHQRVSVAKQVNAIKIEAGLPKDFRPLHGLRHVYASMLASSGQVDMYTLQKLLTHKSPQMTQRYAHLRDDALKRASDLAGDIIKQATKQKAVNIQVGQKNG